MSVPSTAAAIGVKIVAHDETGTVFKLTAKNLEGLKKAAAKSQPVSDLAKKLGYLGRSSKGVGAELDELAWHTLGRLGSAAPRAAMGLARLGAGLALAAPVAATAGIIGFTEHLMTMGADASRAAQRLGLPVETLSRFQIASRLAGASAEDATNGLNGLQATLNAAAHGQDPAAFAMFKSLGIDMARGAKDVTSVLPQIANVTQRLAQVNPAAAQRFLDLTGVGRQLYFVFKDGAAGLARYNGEAQQLGPITEENARKALELQRAQVGLSVAFENFGQTVGGTFAPALTALLHTFQTYLTEHRPDIERFFGVIEHGLEEITKPENMVALRKGIDDFIAGLKEAFHWIEEMEQSPLLRHLLGLPTAAEPGGPGIGHGIPSDGDDPTDAALARLDRDNGLRRDGRLGQAEPAGPARPAGNRPSPINGISPNVQAAHDFLRQQGWDEAQTAGILGHLRGEGGAQLDPHAFNPDGGGQGAQGFGQWRGPRIDQFRAMFGHDPRSGTLDEELKYLQWELTHSEHGAGAAIQQTHDPAEAARLMNRLFGRPFARDLPFEQNERGAWGADYYRLFTHGQPPGGTSAQPPPVAPPPGHPVAPVPPPAAGQPSGRTPVQVPPDVTATPLPYAPGAVPAAAPAGGVLRVQIQHDNAPPGTRIRVDTDSIDPRQIDITAPVTRRSLPTPNGPALPGG